MLTSHNSIYYCIYYYILQVNTLLYITSLLYIILFRKRHKHIDALWLLNFQPGGFCIEVKWIIPQAPLTRAPTPPGSRHTTHRHQSAGVSPELNPTPDRSKLILKPGINLVYTLVYNYISFFFSSSFSSA